MITADEARKLTEKVVAREAEEDRERSLANQARKLEDEERVKILAAKLLANVCDSIEREAGSSKRSAVFGFWDFDNSEDRLKREAYREVMKILGEPPYNYNVGHSSRNGFDDEGSHSWDFYTYHEWTVSW